MWVWLSKGNRGGPPSDENVLFLDYIDVNILIMVLYYSFTCYHWLLNKGYKDLSIIYYNAREITIFFKVSLIRKKIEHNMCQVLCCPSNMLSKN